MPREYPWQKSQNRRFFTTRRSGRVRRRSLYGSKARNVVYRSLNRSASHLHRRNTQNRESCVELTHTAGRDAPCIARCLGPPGSTCSLDVTNEGNEGHEGTYTHMDDNIKGRDPAHLDRNGRISGSLGRYGDFPSDSPLKHRKNTKIHVFFTFFHVFQHLKHTLN